MAIRLAQPPKEQLEMLLLHAIQVGGTSVHGHQRWDDVTSKMLMPIAFEPLRRRIHYVAARVAWALREQKPAVAEWMATLGEGPNSRVYSPLFPQHLQVLRTSPITRELVFNAFDAAANNVAVQLLRSLESTLTAGCMHAELMLRPPTVIEMDPPGKDGDASASSSAVFDKTKEQRSSDAMARVKAEMKRRSGPNNALPKELRDRVFEPRDAPLAMPYVEQLLRHAFSVLTNQLAGQAFAFADTLLAALCRREIDETMNRIEFTPEQHTALTSRHEGFHTAAQKTLTQHSALQRCIAALRNARQ